MPKLSMMNTMEMEIHGNNSSFRPNHTCPTCCNAESQSHSTTHTATRIVAATRQHRHMHSRLAFSLKVLAMLFQQVALFLRQVVD
jgi:hypothetical protein